MKLKLSTGKEIEVSPIRFEAWRTVRSSLIGLLSEKVLAAVTSVANGPLMAAVRKELAAHEATRLAGAKGATDSAALLRAALDELSTGALTALAAVIRDVGDVLADMSDEIALGCVGVGELEGASAVDFLMVRGKALELSNLGELLDLEKNFVRGVVNVLETLIGKSAAPRGGSRSSI